MMAPIIMNMGHVVAPLLHHRSLCTLLMLMMWCNLASLSLAQQTSPGPSAAGGAVAGASPSTGSAAGSADSEACAYFDLHPAPDGAGVGGNVNQTAAVTVTSACTIQDSLGNKCVSAFSYWGDSFSSNPTCDSLVDAGITNECKVLLSKTFMRIKFKDGNPLISAKDVDAMNTMFTSCLEEVRKSEGASQSSSSPQTESKCKRGRALCSCLVEGKCKQCEAEVMFLCANAGENATKHMPVCAWEHWDWSLFGKGEQPYENSFCGHFDPTAPTHLSYTPMNPHGMAIVKAASMLCKHPFQFDVSEHASFINATGMGMYKQTFLDQMVDGAIMTQFTVSDLQDMGFNLGMAKNFYNGKKQFLSLNQPIAKCTTPGDQLKIDVKLTINQLISIDEVKFDYKVAFTVFMVWTDMNMWTENCPSAADDKIEQDSCQYVWKPPVTSVSSFLNVRPDDFELLKRYMWTDYYTKTVLYQLDVVGTFSAPMGFKKYPGDKQDLPINFVIDTADQPEGLDYSRKSIIFDPVKIILPERLKSRDDGKDLMSGWKIKSARAEESEYLSIDLMQLADSGPMREMIDNWLLGVKMSRPQQIKTDAQAREHLRQASTASMLTAYISVERVTVFYMINYVMVIVVLTALSWAVFFVDATDLSDRVSFVMGLLIALNVFQLILVNIMPVTSYLTPMHELIVVSLFYTVGAAAESVMVYQLNKRVAVKTAVIEKIQASMAVAHAPKPSVGNWAKKAKINPAKDDTDVSMTSVGPSPNGDGGDSESGVLHPSEQSAPPQAKRRWISAVNGCMNIKSFMAYFDTAEMFLAEHLDTICLITFPITYAIYVAVTFS